MEQAIRSGEWAVAASLLSSGSLAGLGIAVEVAGFAAYILAAQASAVIPLVGGQFAVSALAVLANPLFIAMAIPGMYILTNRQLQKSVPSSSGQCGGHPVGSSGARGSDEGAAEMSGRVQAAGKAGL